MLGLISGELGGMEVVYLLAESLPLQMRLLVCWREMLRERMMVVGASCLAC